MSILLECDQGWIISHPKFFDSLKIFNASRGQEDSVSGMNCSLFKLNPNLFDIKDQFIKNKTTKEKDTLLPANADQAQNFDDYDVLSPSKKVNVWPDFQTELHRLFREIVAIGHSVTCFSDDDSKSNDTYQGPQEEEVDRKNNFIARRTAAEFLKIPHPSIFHAKVKLSGANSTDYTVLHCISGQEFLFPPKTAFYCGDISRILEEDLLVGKESFDFVLMDPPWMNKYIWRNRKRRHAEGGGYEMIDNLQLEGMRIDRICNDGALIAVWCTNAAAHHKDLVQKIFPAWHVTYLTTWYWVKVTKSGQPILPFQPIDKKQPYEILVIGRYTSSCDAKTDVPELSPASPSNTCAAPSSSDSMLSDLRKMKLIVSVPSSIHSHKPPVIDILRKYLPEDPKCCELFARYLVPGFTSVGNEVFKLQHKNLYVQVQDEKEKPETSHL